MPTVDAPRVLPQCYAGTAASQAKRGVLRAVTAGRSIINYDHLKPSIRLRLRGLIAGRNRASAYVCDNQRHSLRWCESGCKHGGQARARMSTFNADALAQRLRVIEGSADGIRTLSRYFLTNYRRAAECVKVRGGAGWRWGGICTPMLTRAHAGTYAHTHARAHSCCWACASPLS